MTHSHYNSFFNHQQHFNVVNSSDSTLVFFKAAFHANPGVETQFTGSKLYMFKHIFLKF